MHTVTLGPEGTYSHRAARTVSDSVAFRPSVTAIVEAVADGSFDRGVVPIENSIEGSVTETLDALAARDVSIVREVVTPITHALLAQAEDFETVTSHSQALAQCRSFLADQYPDVARESVASTAAAVELAREDPSVAAIAHPSTAEQALRVLATEIQDRPSNETRFFVLGPESARSPAGGKTTIVIYPASNHPGLLYELLGPFEERGVNLTRIESRPSGKQLGDYRFHLDLEGGLYEPRIEAAVEAVEAVLDDGWVRWLGSYDVEHAVE
ncbi:prephenate dehydratase [Halovivax ruber XH-70]|uniref:Prephenate dehydratase n=1 Tax=Halovivax ruber (strain DSM 18193 / JCM 13892 / XH-70) TaxID=797302 RepID=L0ICI9_HALRX|nr:prephenate dehydratase [Halovivax ruber]AGB17275.1 prephenate dehydratase [Halovivax ruber XH-70]